MRKEKILEILENAKDGNGAVPMRLVRTAFDKLPEPCEDMISRQAAIDALDVLCQEHRYRIPGKRETYSEYNEAWQDALDRAEGLIFNLPPIQPEPHWIPVSERLPEDYVDVLVWFEYFRYGDYNCMYATHGIGNYSKEYNSWTINHETGWKDLHVFAWMPLPEPYKPSKSKENEQ